MKKILSVGSIAGSLLLPIVTFAAPGDFSTLTVFFGGLVNFINSTLVPLIFALAFLLFLWGIFKYFFWGGGEEEKREEGKQLMLWAIIAFLLMVSIWGIVNLLSKGLGFNDSQIDSQIPFAPITR